MFSRIFGQTSDARLEFRQSGAIALLARSTIPLGDAYWAQYWRTFDRLSDVTTLLDSGSLFAANPDNLINLIASVSLHLSALVQEEAFPQPDTGREALNCVRVMFRVIPFLQPDTAATQSAYDRLFWEERRERVESSLAEGTEQDYFVIDDEDDQGAGKSDGREIIVPPLAQRLLSMLVDLCFIPGLTLPEECRSDHSNIVYAIWEYGIASPVLASSTPTSPSILTARLEILRLITLLLSLPSLGTAPSHFASIPNRWRDALVYDSTGTLDRKVVLSFLCSLLNTAMSSRSTSAIDGIVNTVVGVKSIGGAIEAATAATEKLSGVVSRKEDPRGLLVGQCLQLLSILLLDHAPLVNLEQGVTPINRFASSLAKLHRPSDFEFISTGFHNLFSLALNQSFLPGVVLSNSITEAITEALVILSRLISINVKFLPALISSRVAGKDLVVDLLNLAIMWKDDANRFGLVRLIAFLLQTITAEPNFLTDEATLRHGVTGTLGDFIVLSISTLIFTTKARLSSLYPSLIISLANISSHLTNLSLLASNKFLQLFLAISAPSFVLMEEGNPRLVYYLLEALNNIVHLRLSDNPNLIYYIVLHASRFEELSFFTLRRGIALARRERQVRQASSGATATSPLSPTSSIIGLPSANESLSSPTTLRFSRSLSSLSLSTRSTKDVNEAETVLDIEGDKEGDGGEEKESFLVEGGEGVETGAEATAMKREVSEKARGKMRDLGQQRRSIGYDRELEEELEENAEADHEPFIGKNGFVPTEGWVSSWRQGLPLDSIQLVLSELRTRVLALSTDSTPPPPTPTPTTLSFLRSVSLDHILPPLPASARRTRKFVSSVQADIWIASLVYGRVYLTLFDVVKDVRVNLFAVARMPRGLTASSLVNGAANFVLAKVGNVGR